MSFVQKLDAESLAYFNDVSKRAFSEQAIFVLNAFYDELHEEADCIYECAFEVIKMVDMRWRNIKYIHLYEEGNDLDFDMALYLFESLGKFFEDSKNKKWASHTRSIPAEMTAITRKKELRERVDVNFDGRVSFLEYLLYQYNLSPKDLMDRSVKGPSNPELEKAKLALAEVNKKIREYEAEKARLEAESELGGVKGLRAKNELAQLNSGPLAETLRRLLITAEAAVRIAAKSAGSAAGEGQPRTEGSIWWLQKDLAVKKAKYGGK